MIKKRMIVGLIAIFLLTSLPVASSYVTTSNDDTKATNQNGINFKIGYVDYEPNPPFCDHTFFDADIILEGEITDTTAVEVVFIDRCFGDEYTQTTDVTFEPSGLKRKTARFVYSFNDRKLHEIEFIVNPDDDPEETNTHDNDWSTTVRTPKTKNVEYLSIMDYLFHIMPKLRESRIFSLFF